MNRRLALLCPRGAVDVESFSRGRFDADPQAVYDRWSEFTAWVAEHAQDIEHAEARPYDESDLGAPVPAPRQVFAIGLNYRDHAAEAGLPLPENGPVVFAKFPSSITGPGAVVELPSDAVDYEAELVVVIGTPGHRVAADDAWSHVAGLTLGQDISERVVQFQGPTPQFSPGKSFPGFSPIGPVLVTPDEFDDADDIELGCTLNGRRMQQGRTRDMVFTVPRLIAFLSAIVPLSPGDLIFTGTPAGIGWARDPKIVLRDGDRLVTHAEVIGEMTTTFIAAAR
ncbi:fumarylacetoacetate hydrolase family protein [Thermopolyspora sp. NPDC052614]|uniref:fumarylacetoacetate hydrolase family protein n=1 Tax=Thermopolyspora sp. NPDC052614 TaxID=3155682 RepID=UPI00342D019A